MPYDIRKRDGKYCLYKEGTDELVTGSCHADRAETERMARAIMANENKATVYKAADGTRHMLIVTSNSYKDREDQTITTDALTGYVERQWQGEQFAGDNVLLFWHDGPPIGDIVWADMEGPFLVEVARERKSGLPMLEHYTRAIWDHVERNDEDWGASHGFGYDVADLEPDEGRGTFKQIHKVETSVLPREYAANALTYSGVIMSDKRDKTLDAIAPGWGQRIREALGMAKAELDEQGVQHKALGPTVTKADLLDAIEYTVKRINEQTVTKAAGDDSAPVDVRAEAEAVLDALMDVPTVDVEAAAAVFAEGAEPVEEVTPDADTDAPEDDNSAEVKALFDSMTKQTALVTQIVDDQAALVEAMQTIGKGLESVARSAGKIESLEVTVKALEAQLNDRPRRATRALETAVENDDLPEPVLDALKAAQGKDGDFFGIPLHKLPPNGA